MPTGNNNALINTTRCLPGWRSAFPRLWSPFQGISVRRTRRSCNTLPTYPQRPCRHTSSNIIVKAAAGSGLEPGLYGVPGIYTPDDLIETTARLALHCQELQRHIELARGPELHSLVRRHHEAVYWLRPLTDHCEAHHEGREWREAASRAAQALQAIDDLLSCQLAAHPYWGTGSSGRATTAPGSNAGPTAAESQHRPPKSAPTAATQAAKKDAELPGNGAAARVPGSRTAAPTLDQSRRAVASVPPNFQPVTGKPDSFSSNPDQTLGSSTVGLLSRPSSGPSLRLVEEGVARAAGMSVADASERDALEALERDLVAGFRAALTDPRVAPMPLVVFHDQEVRGDPLLARYATPATEEEVALALCGGKAMLPLTGAEAVAGSAVYEEEGWWHGEEEAEGASGQARSLTVQLAPVAAATYLARSRAGRLWSVRLTGQLTRLLLDEHPSAKVRRAVHSVTHGSQAGAALRLMDLLRPLRDNLAECFGQPSYAHLRMGGSVAGDPRVALALLADLLSAIRPLAEQEVVAMQRLQLRMAADEEAMDGPAGGRAEAGARVSDPLDLEGSIDFLTNVQRPPRLSATDWRDMALYFTVDGQLRGLSRHLSYALGLELRATLPAPHELWQQGRVFRLELHDLNPDSDASMDSGAGSMREAAANSDVRPAAATAASATTISDTRAASAESPQRSAKAPLGVLYVFLDPDCSLPFTVLVRHGYQAYGPAPWPAHGQDQEQGNPGARSTVGRPVDRAGDPGELSRTTGADTVAAQGSCVPHVAVHLPADQMTLEPGGYLVPEQPGLIRTVAHELGHALHYILSYRPGALPEDNACYSSTDFVELASHVLERWVTDPRVLADLSCHAVSGASLAPRCCAQLAASLSVQSTWLELQQHTLAAAADLLMHLHGTVDVPRLRLLPAPPPAVPPPPSPSPSAHLLTAPSLQQVPDQPRPQPQEPRQNQEQNQEHHQVAGRATTSAKGHTADSSSRCRNDYSAVAAVAMASSNAQWQPAATVAAPLVIDLASTPTLELISALWKHHSSLPGGAFQPTRGFMTVLPGFIHNAATMYAYPLAQMVAAALWKRHFAEGLSSPAAARGGRLLRRALLECGEAGGAAAALEALLGPGCMRWKSSVGVGADAGTDVDFGAQEMGRDVREGEGAESSAVGGDSRFAIPDLAHEAFQEVDPLVF